MTLAVGAQAPDFTLTDHMGNEVTLSSLLRERAVLVVFYPFAFSGVCTGELTGFRDRLGDFETDSATLVAISCDPVFSLRAFADRDALFFPLLSDFWPHGEVSRAYEAFSDEIGASTRRTYLIARDGTIAWAAETELSVARDLDAAATSVAALV